MVTVTRRDALCATAVLLAAPALMARGARAAEGSAVLVAPPGKLDPDSEDLAGMRICAGGVGSASDQFIRRRGAMALYVPLAARFEAVERGLCDAMIFVSDDKSAEELTKEIRVFMPGLEQFEFRTLQTD